MAQAAKHLSATANRRKIAKRTAALPEIRTMQDLVSALGGASNIDEHIATGTDGVLSWFERGHVARGFGLQVPVSLLQRGHTPERVNSHLFGHPTWTAYTVPVEKPRRR